MTENDIQNRQPGNAEPEGWPIAATLVTALIVLALWIAAITMDLFDSRADGLANLAAIWLLTFGAAAFLIAVLLQSRPGWDAKTSVAAMLAGTILMITGGVIAHESIERRDHPEPLERGFFLERDDRAGFDRLTDELCRRLEATDILPRRLGELGDLLADLCG